MKVRPFKLVNQSEKELIRTLCKKAFEQWKETWLLASATVDVQCYSGEEVNKTSVAKKPTNWLRFSAGQEWLTLSYSEHMLKRLGVKMFDVGPLQNAAVNVSSPTLISDVVKNALSDMVVALNNHLAALNVPLRLDSELAPDTDSWTRGSGVMIVEASLSEDTVAVVFNATYVEKLFKKHRKVSKSTEKLIDPRRCLGKETVKLEVDVGEAELELGVLQTLAPGDVITLNSKVDEPLNVKVSGRKRLCRAFLGTLDGNRAIQLVVT